MSITVFATGTMPCQKMIRLNFVKMMCNHKVMICCDV